MRATTHARLLRATRALQKFYAFMRSLGLFIAVGAVYDGMKYNPAGLSALFLPFLLLYTLMAARALARRKKS